MTPPEPAILTGLHLVEVVLRHGRARPSEVVVLRGGSSRGLSRLVRLAETSAVPVRWLEPDGMRELTGGAAEVAAVLARRDAPRLEDVLTDNAGPVLAVVVEGVEDPHNLGDILRTALAAGATLAVLDSHARSMSRDALARSSAAASECLPLVFTDDLAAELDALNARDVTTVATTPSGGEDLFDAALGDRIALVIGGEHRGLSKHILDKCQRHVTIPTSSAVQSLSAAASAAVVLFEAVRRRSGSRRSP